MGKLTEILPGGGNDVMAAFIAAAKSAEGAIDLTIGDPDLPTPYDITKAAMTDALAGHTRYTAAAGYEELTAGIASHYAEKYRVSYKNDEIVVTVGGCFALYAAFEALLETGDEVIVPAPFFPPYEQQIVYNGGTPVWLPTRAENGFLVDPDALCALITPRTKCILLNYPNNPTGAVQPRSVIERVAEIARRHGLYIISDEVYDGFCYDEPFTHTASLYREKTITIGSFSKNFAMSGWRVGFMLAPPAVVRRVLSLIEATTYTAPSPSQRAAIYAIRHYDELAPQVAAIYKDRLDFAYERLATMRGVTLVKPKGGIYLFPALPCKDSVALCTKLLEKEKTVLLPGAVFGEAGEGHARIAVTATIAVLCDAFDRMEEFFNNLHST